MEQTGIKKIREAGNIAKQIKKELPNILKKDKLLLEIAEEIETMIKKLGGELAFPTNLSINEIAAHYTPSYNDETKAHGLLKVDFGVHIGGFISDCAVSFDLENSEENKKLIEVANNCFANAIEAVKDEKSLGEIGGAIQKTAEENNFSPVQNLSGHSLDNYQIHSGITIPNYDNNNENVLDDGAYAIEPFVTKGVGIVKDGKPSGIYEVRGNAVVRDPKAREIFQYILENYQTLPFCSRWLVKEFGTRALISLSQIEQSGALHQFPQLAEKSGANVAQAENTILIEDGKVEVTSQ
ncbi:MAG: type II methionyl aminopeptidase [Nanoarchaeota archaeon]|nr:type II methionyl aminopeptidase [Nanoarchaeota archaeon]